MQNINYDINGLLFPFTFASRHFEAMSQEVAWQGWTVHLIVGILEYIPPINYIVAIFDSIFNNVPAVPVPGVPPVGFKAQQKVVEDPKASLGECLEEMLGGLAFGLTTGTHPTSKHLNDLALRGIHSLDDLQALGLFEFDEMALKYQNDLFEFLTRLSSPGDEKISSNCCAKELEKLEALRDRAAPDLTDPKYNRTDLHAVRSKLCTVKEALERHMQQVFDPSVKYPDDYSLDAWHQIQTDLQALNALLVASKNNWTAELNALVAIAKRIQTAEPDRQSVLQRYSIAEPIWNQLKEVVTVVVERLEFLTNIEAMFVGSQYSEQEIAVFQAMENEHKQACQQMKALSLALKEFHLGSLQKQINQVQGVLQTLKMYSQLEKVVLLRLYMMQVNITVAWTALKQGGIINLTTYRQDYPNNNLYEIGLNQT